MTRLVRLIGSKWDGSRVDAPKREIPEYGLKLKLKGHNFRVKQLETGELVAYYLGELADDIVDESNPTQPSRHRYDVCEQCNYDQHTCPGCGAGLSHDGINLSDPRRGYPHGTECVE